MRKQNRGTEWRHAVSQNPPPLHVYKYGLRTDWQWAAGPSSMDLISPASVLLPELWKGWYTFLGVPVQCEWYQGSQ